MNKFIGIGNLSKDIDFRYLQNGTAVANTSIALNKKYKKNGEIIEDVTFVDLTIWSKAAENAAEYLSKGSKVAIEGELVQNIWEAEDGRKMSKIKINVQKIEYLSTKSNDNKQVKTTQNKPKNDYVERMEAENEDIPF